MFTAIEDRARVSCFTPCANSAAFAPSKEIGVATDDGRAVEQPTIEARLIKKAKRMGGTAVILSAPVRRGTEMAGFSVVDTFLYKATVVVYQ